ncbi:DUF5655 domain-containing protein [Nocardioides daphniae]|uniref:DUF5655 domain-containing protein n=1 Tax=Nocardioides daphniae TaxID=402297 RepID=A0ABQ1QA90_9ACTN|nr:DUF5655 domain-containing protein [Nocardioides daphniae]GGD19811.1 hypothetical protein GCM10007231_18750 [Nocardioides daphniae]
MAGERTVEELFEGHPRSLELCRAVEEAVGAVGDSTVTVGRSQVAFRRRRGFAYVWRPGQYVRSDVPAMLSLALPHRIDSPRFKEVVHPSPGVWMHHLELHEVAEVDAEVRGWLREAYEHAG